MLYKETATGISYPDPEGVEGELFWLKLKYPFFKDEGKCILFHSHNFKHSAILDHAFSSADHAINCIQLIDPNRPNCHHNREWARYSLSQIQEIANKLHETIELFKTQVRDDPQSVRFFTNNSVYRDSSVLDHGEALLSFIQQPKGRKFIKELGNSYKISSPDEFILAIQLLLDFELLVFLLQKRDKELDIRNIPDRVKKTWRDRAIGMLFVSICKVSSLIMEASKILSKNFVHSKNGAKNNQKFREAVLHLYSFLQKGEELKDSNWLTRQEKLEIEKEIGREWLDRSDWAVIIAKLLSREYYRNKLGDIENRNLNSEVFRILENNRLPCKIRLYPFSKNCK